MVVQAIGKHLGKKVDIVDMAFDGLIPALMTAKSTSWPPE
jgi:polar amino acid transport system substrate-binding protein